MGLTLMADDVQRLLGRLEAGFEAVIDRVNRSDDATAQRFGELAAQHETDKQHAIQARAEREARDAEKFKRIEEKATQTYGLAASAFRWIEEKGDPLIKRVDGLHERVSKLEGDKTVEAAEERGSLKTWGIIGGALSIGGGAVGAVLTYKDQIMAFLRGN